MAYTWSRYKFLDDITKFSGGTTVLDAKEGDTIPGVPEHWVSGEIRYDHPVGFWVAPNFQWSPAGYAVDFANNVENPPFFVLNLKAGWQVNQQWRVFAEGRNLTDVNYSGSVIAAGYNNTTTIEPRAFQPSWPLSVFGGVEFRMP